ncbi:YbaB/EbfC family nucleoid-associated protein [Chryseobacterium sp.]|uniref:YbaB/EbfC family nucleoid-associated protein n=1 Tax=Chryseobacterium sp. TaxID=1871047 RepID=UPI0026163C86|nr:YbaB/EbfC family nucleoid-associated protein [Chryseobacterium sp.]
MFNLSIEKAQLIQQKTEEIKNTLDQELITHSSSNGTIHITVSITGNVKDIKAPKGVEFNSIIPTLNEVLSNVNRTFEIKRAEMLQMELMKL